jgi:hypothetical protein
MGVRGLCIDRVAVEQCLPNLGKYKYGSLIRPCRWHIWCTSWAELQQGPACMVLSHDAAQKVAGIAFPGGCCQQVVAARVAVHRLRLTIPVASSRRYPPNTVTPPTTRSHLRTSDTWVNQPASERHGQRIQRPARLCNAIRIALRPSNVSQPQHNVTANNASTQCGRPNLRHNTPIRGCVYKQAASTTHPEQLP